MSAFAIRLSARRPAPTWGERMLLRASRRLEAFAVARMERRIARSNPVVDQARAEADDRRRTAQALGGLGIPPR